MVADDVDYRALSLAGVVQVREAVAQARPEMQKCRGRLARHACIAIGGSGYHALEQAQDRPHPGKAVKGVDEMHLGRTGIGEADVHATCDDVRNRLSAPFIGACWRFSSALEAALSGRAEKSE